MAKKIDHIGIAVENLQDAVSFYENILGLALHGTESIDEQGVKVAFLPIGDTELELLESTASDSPIAEFINLKGQGIHHIAFKVDCIEKTIELMKKMNIRLIDEKPRYGAGGAKIAFLHPKSTKGVLIELSERK